MPVEEDKPEFPAKQEILLSQKRAIDTNYGYNAIFIAIKEYVIWNNMAKDIKVFVKSCLHCVSSASGEKVARPLGTQVHATKPS
jgi:hypothetical protein